MMRVSAMLVEHSEGAAMTLDFAVSRAVARSQLLEHALHSRKLWSITIGEIRSVAKRFQHDRGVEFTACFTDVSPEADFASLYEGETLREIQSIRYPGSGRFWLTWDLSLEETLTV